jgi:hypothetical protein
MRIDKERGNAMLPYEKVFSVAGAVCFLALIVFAVLELLDRFGMLSLGFEPIAWIGLMGSAWQTCQLIVQWRKNDELDQKYALFCVIFLGGLFAVLALVGLFVNL